jgi:hypothetical protein
MAKNLIHPSSGTSLNPTGVIMKLAYFVLLAASAATLSVAATAAPLSTDEIRAEASNRTVEAERAAALQPFESQSPEVRVTDTDSARLANGQALARRAHDSHLAEVLRAGNGVNLAPINVTDTDSARAAAGQTIREQALVAEYADYVKAQVAAETSGTSKQ